ncbi:MAG: DUF1292 domain-containing protein [Peptostreptococcaceae bacterium]|jgi:uncharacterized protein YrzB (UPF0473 family)|nr:DUF1292 domain-containing protein [Peptostreptococcaceae bacterium]
MNENENIVALVDENGEETRFEVVMTLTANDMDYAILLPIEDDDEQAYIFRIEGEEEDPKLMPIETDEEYEAVLKEYEEIMKEN